MSRKITMEEMEEIMKQGKEIWQTRNKKIKIQNKKWRVQYCQVLRSFPDPVLYPPSSAVCECHAVYFLQGNRNEDVCEPGAEDFDRPSKRPQNKTADVNPDPHIKQKTRLTLCPTLPSLCTEANTNDFFFFFALPINPVARTFRIKVKLRCCRCHARAHCFIA